MDHKVTAYTSHGKNELHRGNQRARAVGSGVEI